MSEAHIARRVDGVLVFGQSPSIAKGYCMFRRKCRSAHIPASMAVQNADGLFSEG